MMKYVYAITLSSCILCRVFKYELLIFNLILFLVPFAEGTKGV